MITVKKIKMFTRKQSVTKKEKRLLEQQRKMPDSSPFLLILYLVGMTGLLSAVNEVAKLSTDAFLIAVIVSVAASTLLWYIYIYQNKYFNFVVLMGCAAAIVYSLVNFREIDTAVVSIFTGNPSALPAPLILLFSSMLILFVFTLEFISRNHSLMFLLCAAIIIFTPIGGITLSPLTVVMICVFQFGFYVMNMAHASPRKTLHMPKKAAITGVSTLITAAALLLAFLPSFIAEDVFEDDIYSGVYVADAYVQDIIKAISNISETGVTDGSVSRGNLRQTGEKVFTAETLNYPLQRLYLKSFVGSGFDGDAWSNAFMDTVEFYSVYEKTITEDRQNYYNSQMFYREGFVNNLIVKAKNEYFRKVIEEFEGSTGLKAETVRMNEGRDIVITVSDSESFDFTMDGYFLYHNDFFSNVRSSNKIDDELMKSRLNFPEYPLILLENTDTSDPIADIFAWNVESSTYYNDIIKGNMIHITPEANKPQNVLVPYGAKFSEGKISKYSRQVSFAYSNPYKYINSFTWAKDSSNDNKNQETNSDEETEPLEAYEDFINYYKDSIKAHYTNVPYEDMPRLLELCSDISLDDVNEITTFILYTLQTHATYSTTPGSVPSNKNTIEYFLFDNHKGFCVHFATSAVMMYRMFGIPARYVSGFAVDQAMFSNMNDASADQNSDDYKFKADVTDKSAHSWVEIFLDGYGWVPVEVTPTTAGTMIAEYPGYDRGEMNSIMKKYGWHFNKNSSSEQNAGNNGGANDFELSKLQIVLIVMAALVAATVAFIMIRRKYILRNQDSMSCRRIFHRLIQALHCSDLLTGLNGSESYFAEVLSEAVPEKTKAECEEMVGILYTEHYSPEPVTEEQKKFVADFYKSVVPYLYQHTKWYKKPVFRFIKALA